MTTTRTQNCPACGNEFTRHYNAVYCFPCCNDRAARAMKELRSRQDIAERARQAVGYAVSKGDLPRLPHPGIKCADCGKPAKQYDHRDYRYALLVAPVCGSCNKKRGPGKNASSAELKAG